MMPGVERLMMIEWERSKVEWRYTHPGLLGGFSIVYLIYLCGIFYRASVGNGRSDQKKRPHL
jgi:hypothetical protein